MDQQTFESLQFPEIVARVADHCRSALGRELLMATRPAASLEQVEALLEPVREALTLLDRGLDLALDGLGDPRPIWDEATPEGHALEAGQLLEAACFLEALRRADTFLREVRSQAPAMARMGEGLTPMPAFERDLRRAILPDGSVADQASDALARIRAELRRAEQRIRSAVDRLVTEYAEKGFLQDAFATLRNGRYVFPVRNTMKQRVAGIVHGASKTGETFFVEPTGVVEMSNEFEEQRQAEAREIHRILLSLTSRLRPALPQLRADTERLARLDTVWGRAHAARRFGWSLPRIVAGESLRLEAAHHPLIHLHQRENSIAVSLQLHPEDHVIVISGPNAGGKTTLLKTLGLAVLLVQSGIPAPVSPDSHLPVFQEVWTDIGDAQDVAAGQSTFSAHARRMAQILRHARRHSLVLLDELGTATDPSEGAALARACLEVLRVRGSLALATCHLTPLKQWAHDTPGVRNASFSLDAKSRRPTFSLMLDIPGTSEAFVIAEREGIAPEILDKARASLNQGEVSLTSLLRSLGQREQRLAQSEDELQRRLNALADQEELARRRADTLREERRRLRESIARDREEHLARLRDEIEHRIASLPAREAALAQQRSELSRARREVDTQQREAEWERRRAEQSLPPALTPEELAPGKAVYVIDLRETGSLRAVDMRNHKAQVLLGRGLVVEVSLDGLSRLPEQTPVAAPLRGTQSPLSPSVLEEDPEVETPVRKRSRKIKRQEVLAKAPVDLSSSCPPTSIPALDWHRGRRRESSPATPRASGTETAAPGTDRTTKLRFERKPGTPWLLDLHGRRVEEAVEMVDKYLDDAVLADLPYVKLCHGTGSGALARALREFLASHAHVAAWRYGLPEEGGAGVTVVELR